MDIEKVIQQIGIQIEPNRQNMSNSELNTFRDLVTKALEVQNKVNSFDKLRILSDCFKETSDEIERSYFFKKIQELL